MRRIIMIQKTKQILPGAVLWAGIILLLFVAACDHNNETKTIPKFTLTPGTVTGEGTFEISPEGKVKAGEQITLTALPGTGYALGSWDLSSPELEPVQTETDNVWTFLMPSENVIVGATFVPTFSITQGVMTGGGTIKISPEGPVKAGTKISLTALPDTGYALGSWDLSPELDPTQTEISTIWTFLMPSANVTVGAVFTQTFSITKGDIIIGEGEFYLSPTENIVPGTEIALNVASDLPFVIIRWSFTPASAADSLRKATAPNSWYFTMPASDVTVDVEILDPDTDLAFGRGEFALASDTNPWADSSVAANAFDGEKYTGTGSTTDPDSKTHWQADGDQNPRHWIGVDLGNVFEINSVRIYWYPGAANAWDGMTAFEIQVAGEKPDTFETDNYGDEGWTVAATYKYQLRSGAGTDGPTSDFDGTTALDSSTRWNVQVPLDDSTEARWIRIKMIEPLTEWDAGTNPTDAPWTLWPRISSFEVYKQLPE